MKVLFDVGYPLSWAEGGFSVQIRQTKLALERLGVEVSWVDYHGASIQDADLIHYFGGPATLATYRSGKALGRPAVVSYLAPHGFIKPTIRDYGKRWLRAGLRKAFGSLRLFGCMGIGFEDADAFILLNQAEYCYTTFTYQWPKSRCHIIPNGVDAVFLDASIEPEPVDGLFYPSYICPRKNQVELARLAKALHVRVVFAGRAQGEFPAYFEVFQKELDGQYAVWLGEIRERRRMAALYRGALGTFLASQYDNQGLVLLESLACGRPVMGPDLPSVRTHFGDAIRYCPQVRSKSFGDSLVAFEDFCRGGGQQSVAVPSWHEIGQEVLGVYKRVLGMATTGSV